MFEIGICEIVAELATHLGVTKEVPTNDGYRYQARGIEFKFDVGLSLFVKDQSVEVRTYVAYAISGTRVWFKCGKSGRQKEQNGWINTSNHDSCWRTDGLSSPLNELYFRFAERINAETGGDVAPSQMRAYARFLYSRRPWTHVNMSWTKDLNDPNRYRNILLSIDPIL